MLTRLKKGKGFTTYGTENRSPKGQECGQLTNDKEHIGKPQDKGDVTGKRLRELLKKMNNITTGRSRPPAK